MERQPLISVVISLYNSEAFIEETLGSVLAQTYSNLEVLVVDDCSTDGGPAVVRKLAARDTRVRLMRTPENSGGPAKPRNLGVFASRGDFVAFLDSDDLWDHQKLALQVAALMNCPGALYSFTNYVLIDEQGAEIEKRDNLLVCWLRRRIINCGYKGALISNQLALSSSIINKKLLEMYQFDEDPYMHAAEDYGLWLRLLQDYPDKMCYLDERLLRYRRHTNGISYAADWQRIRANYCVSKHFLATRRYSGLGFSLIGFLLRGLQLVLQGTRIRPS